MTIGKQSLSERTNCESVTRESILQLSSSRWLQPCTITASAFQFLNRLDYEGNEAAFFKQVGILFFVAVSFAPFFSLILAFYAETAAALRCCGLYRPNSRSRSSARRRLVRALQRPNKRVRNTPGPIRNHHRNPSRWLRCVGRKLLHHNVFRRKIAWRGDSVCSANPYRHSAGDISVSSLISWVRFYTVDLLFAFLTLRHASCASHSGRPCSSRSESCSAERNGDGGTREVTEVLLTRRCGAGGAAAEAPSWSASTRCAWLLSSTDAPGLRVESMATTPWRFSAPLRPYSS